MRESALWPKLREYWHPVAFSEDVDDGPISVTLLDDRIAVCRLGGEVKAFHDLCIHRGTPISLGWVEGEEIICAYHGWAYSGDGRCVRRSQGVNATVLAKTSHGFIQPSVCRGRALNSRATASSSSWEWRDRSVPFGKY